MGMLSNCAMGIGVLDVQELSTRYMLDVMHVEQNISDNLLKHMFGEKNTLNTRRVMEEASIHPWLWLQRRGQHFIKPAPTPNLFSESIWNFDLLMVQFLWIIISMVIYSCRF
jgi:hypothetical protein